MESEKVRLADMHSAGYEFYFLVNGVRLTKRVPAELLEKKVV